MTSSHTACRVSSVSSAGPASTRRTPSDTRVARSAVPGPPLPTTSTPGTRAPAALGEEQRERFLLDVFQSGEVDLRPAVLVHEEAPQLAEQLRVGFVAAEHADAHHSRRRRARTSRCRPRGRTARCACRRRRGRARPGPRSTCARVGRPPGEPNARWTAAATPHPRTMAANTPLGNPVPRYRARERERRARAPGRRDVPGA